MDYKEILKDILINEKEDLIQYWLENFSDDEKSDEYRYYNDFLSFFEECVENDLDPHSPEAETLKHFLTKIIEIKGEDKYGVYFMYFVCLTQNKTVVSKHQYSDCVKRYDMIVPPFSLN